MDKKINFFKLLEIGAITPSTSSLNEGYIKYDSIFIELKKESTCIKFKYKGELVKELMTSAKVRDTIEIKGMEGQYEIKVS